MLNDLALLIVRIVLGVIFLYHGYGKFKAKDYMKFIGYAEFLGAIGLILGILTQYAAAGLILIMLGAIYMKITKWKVPFSTMTGIGYEFDLLIIAASFVIITFGAGIYAIGPMIGM